MSPPARLAAIPAFGSGRRAESLLVGGGSPKSISIDPALLRAYPHSASRPDGRRASRAEESPGSTETRRRITSGGGDPRESATESKPPRVSRGKGERVR